jgi:small conductance mechanosensitive channel
MVKDITLSHTILAGEDGEKITIPNKEIVGRVIVNSQKFRVVQGKICISEGEDSERAVAALRNALGDIENLKGGPAPLVGIHDFTYGGIVIGLRFWVPSEKYFQVRYAVNGARPRGAQGGRDQVAAGRRPGGGDGVALGRRRGRRKDNLGGPAGKIRT